MDTRRETLDISSDIIFKNTLINTLKKKLTHTHFFNEDDAKKLAKSVFELYEDNINTLPGKSVRKFAAIIAHTISYALHNHYILKLSTLFNNAKLHYMLMLLKDTIPKETLLTIEKNEKRNARGYITKCAITCIENDKTYINKDTRIEKYGKIYFKSRADWYTFKRLSNAETFYIAMTSNKKDNQYFLRYSIFTSSNTSACDEETNHFSSKKSCYGDP